MSRISFSSAKRRNAKNAVLKPTKLRTKQLGDAVVAVIREVDSLLLMAVLVQDHKVRIMVLHPLHLEILPLLPPHWFIWPF